MNIRTDSLLYKKISGLSPISESAVEKIFDAVALKHFRKGANIITQGKTCKHIFFIEKGYVRAFITQDGNEINTDFIFENNFATSLKSLRSSLPSDVTLQAGEDTTAFQLDKDRLLSMYKDSPEIESFGRNLLELLLIAQEEHSTLFKIFSPAERYRFLQDNNPQIIQRVSISQLSSYIGVARETLSRIRKRKE